jgi:excisionase family DNA binding protein
MTALEAAAKLGVSRSMVYKLLDQGQIAYLTVGSRKVISEASVSAYILRNTHAELPTDQKPKTKEKTAKKQKVYRFLDL